MPISATGTVAPFPVWSTDQSPLPPGLSRYESMVTPALMRTKSLFGIPLESRLTQPPTPITDDIIQRYINEAVSEVEHNTDLYIYPVTFKEKHDYSREMFTWTYGYIKTNHPNILKVTSVQISFTNDLGSDGFVSFPLEHVHVMPQEGTVQLVPTVGSSFGGFLLSAFSGVQFQAMRALTLTEFPGAIRIEYQCGFEPNKIPAAIVSLIEATAAHRILSSLGHLIFPYSGVSVSIDGVSQSNSTPGHTFLLNRLKDLENQKAELMDVVRGYYSRRLLVDYI